VDIARVTYFYTGTPGTLSFAPTTIDSSTVLDCNYAPDYWCVRLQPSGNGGVWTAPLAGSCPAPRVWHVPADATTIQAGIDSSANGDTVALANGIYVGVGNRDIDTRGKAIVVRSESADPTLCEIDCGGSYSEWHRGFIVASGEGRGTIIEGVTIKNAYVEYPPLGGGLYVDSSSPTIRNCILKNNKAANSFGGGIFCEYASPLIQDCVFVGNSAEGGGAVFCMQTGTSPEIDGCVFDSNVGVSGGGAIEAHFSSSPIITNCTFVGGAASGYGGSALISHYESTPSISACIIAFGAEGIPVVCESDASVSIECTDVFGNSEGDWVACLAGQGDVNGNMSADPLFCDPEYRDYSLDAASPCLSVPGCGRIGALGQGCGVATGVVASDPGVPPRPFLSGSAPNPFNATTTIRFGVPETTDLSLRLYDASGRCIITLVQDRHEAGEFTMGWDGRDESGRDVASGVYFVRLQTETFTATRKLVLLR
jgi:hypothetical protein